MHELAVTENILRLVLAEAEKAGAVRVTRISLVIGELSAIIDESVQLYFDVLSAETIAAGAQLSFTHHPATLQCRACGQVYPRPRTGFACPVCGEEGRLTGDAREFYIDSIEVDECPSPSK